MPKLKISELDQTEKGTGADMSLYFNGTYVRVSRDGVEKAEWSKYSGMHPSKGHVFARPSETFYVPVGHPKAYVEWIYPTGWFNTPKSAVFCQRVPRRQYSKGLSSSGNFRVTTAESLAKEYGFLKTDDPKLSELMGFLVLDAKVHMSVEFINSIFDGFPIYPGLEECYLLLKSKKVFSRALSPDFSLVPHPQTKDFLVFYDDMPVAEMLTKNKIKVVVPDFKTECLEYFHKEGITVVS